MKGFTLVETLVAVFILSIGIVAVLNIFPLGIQIARFSQTASTAVQLAQAKMEQEVSKHYTEILCNETVSPPCQEEKSRISDDPANPFYYYWRELELNYVDPKDDMAIAANDTGIKKIEITVSWRSSLGILEQSVTLVSLIAKR